MVKRLSGYYLLISALSTPLAGLAQTTNSPPAPPAEYQKAHPPREDADLKLSISSSQASFTKGKDLVVDVDLTNVSTEPFWFRSFVEHNEGQLNGFVLRVINSAGQDLPLLPQQPPGRRSRGAYTLQPGQVLHDHLIVNNLVNLSPGEKYNIQVTWKYHKSERRIASNVITVTIPPE
jgi:hypothetical protein